MFGLESTRRRPFYLSRREAIKMAAAAAAVPLALSMGTEADKAYADAPNPDVIADATDFGILLVQKKGRPIWGPDAKSVVLTPGQTEVVFEPYDVGAAQVFTGVHLINKRLRVKYPLKPLGGPIAATCGDTLNITHTIIS